MAFKVTLQTVSNFCSTQADLLPLSGVGGFTNEPFLSIANDAIADLLTNENDWKFNRVEMPMLVTCSGKQDYLFAGATVFSLGSTAQGWSVGLATDNAIVTASGLVTVTTLENHRFLVGDTIYLQGVIMSTGTAGAYTSIFTDNGSVSSWTNGWVITAVTSKTLSFTATAGQSNSDAGGAPGITDLGFLTSGSMIRMLDAASPREVRQLTAFRELATSSRINDPEKVSIISDNGEGVVKLRFYLVPGTTPWAVNLVYQAAAPVKTSLAQDWSPFPDHYSSLYRQAVITRMYRYLNSPLYHLEEQKLQMEIAKAHAADDTEETDVHMTPETPLMDDSVSNGWW